MAIWQYTFRIIFNIDLKELGVNSHLSSANLDNFTFWRDYHYTLSFFKPLTDALIEKASWSNNIRLYGTEESNCIEIFMYEGSIEEVTLRVDFRSDYSSLMNRVVEFCIVNYLSLLDENYNIIYLNTTTILQLINNSSQYQRFTAMQG